MRSDLGRGVPDAASGSPEQLAGIRHEDEHVRHQTADTPFRLLALFHLLRLLPRRFRVLQLENLHGVPRDTASGPAKLPRRPESPKPRRGSRRRPTAPAASEIRGLVRRGVATLLARHLLLPRALRHSRLRGSRPEGEGGHPQRALRLLRLAHVPQQQYRLDRVRPDERSLQTRLQGVPQLHLSLRPGCVRVEVCCGDDGYYGVLIKLSVACTER